MLSLTSLYRDADIEDVWLTMMNLFIPNIRWDVLLRHVLNCE